MGASHESVDADRRRWLLAVLGALVWHAAVFALLEVFEPFAPGEVRASPPRPVELVFARAPQVPETEPRASQDESDAPEYFTELPPDRADLAPERADALSNVDSRAQDRVQGAAESDLPRMQGEAERPSVAMQPSPSGEAVESPGAGRPDAESSDGDTGVTGQTRTDGTDPSAADPLEQNRENDEAATAGQADQGDRTLPGLPSGGAGSDRSPPRSGREGDPREELLRTPARPRAEAPRYLVGVGRQDLFQEEMDNPSGNVSLFGDVSLNTIAWDWAPWWQRFARTYHRNWFPPYAYRIGIISGHQVVDLEVAKDGRLLRLDVVEQEGHESLTESTLATFRAIAPFQPLPRDFPEETLQMRITVTYRSPRRP